MGISESSDANGLKVLDLGDTGLRWVKRRLAARPDLPLRNALGGIALEDGSCWTWAIPGSTVTWRDLEAGLPAGVTQEAHREAVTHFIVQFLSVARHVAVIEDHDASTTDPWLTTNPPKSPWLPFDQHIYWYADSPDRSAVNDFLLAGVGLFTTIALTSLATWPPTRGLAGTVFTELANDARHVLVDAFDFEGWAVWSRTGDQPDKAMTTAAMRRGRMGGEATRS